MSLNDRFFGGYRACFSLCLALPLLCASANDDFLSADDALAAFKVEPGLRIELVAAEPVVIDPVAMAFDEHGRIYVAENRDYPTGPKPGTPPNGTIALLEDKDADGAFETRSDFATGLTYPNGVLPWKGGVFVTCAPDLLYLKDTDGDRKADVRKVVLTGFSTNNTTQLRVSHPTLGLDNWIYLTSGLGTGGKVFSPDHPQKAPVEFKTDSRFNPITGEFEPIEGRSQFGMSFNNAGHRFICMNRVHVQHVVIPGHYLRRNPHLGVTDAIQNCPEEMTPEPLKGHGAAARIFPISENVTTADSHAGTFTAACAVFVYRAYGLPREYRDSVFACEPTGNLVHRDRLIPNGSTFVARRAREGVEFLASTDNWFRPVFLAGGPDGALYICDMYRKTIEHPQYLPQEIRKRTDFDAGKNMGRIYRITAQAAKRRPFDPMSDWKGFRLITMLGRFDDWTSQTAQRLFVERYVAQKSYGPQAKGLAKELKSALRKVGSWKALHALRILDTLNELDDDDVRFALRDQLPAVREHALQLSERRPALWNDALKLAHDPDPRVRLQCALTLGENTNAAALKSLIEIARRDANDSWTRMAAISSLSNREPAALAMLLGTSSVDSNETGLLALLSDISRIIGVAKGPQQLASVLTNIVFHDHDSWRIAALGGMAEGLRNRSEVPGLLELANSETRVQLEGLLQRARTITTNTAAPMLLRQSAVSLMGQWTYQQAKLALVPLLESVQPTPLQVAAVRNLTRFPEVGVAVDLLAPERWKIYTPALREAVLNSLLSDSKHLAGALSAFENGAISAASVDSNRRKQLRQHKDPAIRARAEALFQSAGSSDRMKVYEDWQSVLTLKAAPENGRAVFKQLCAPCHRLDREGINVGPDLFGIRNQPKEAILLHIIVPEHEIAPGFAAYEVETKDGRTLTGVIVADTPAAITLRGGLGQEDTISRSNIASIASHGLSLMPQELEKNMTRQDMADLLAFLKGE